MAASTIDPTLEECSHPEEAEIHFGGANRPVGAPRDVLAWQIAAVPAGGSIDWTTYYFRDRRLAREFINGASK